MQLSYGLFLASAMTVLANGAWLSAGPGASALAASTAQYYSWCMAACMGGASSGSLMATVMTAGMAAPAAASGMCYGAAACAVACSSITGGTAVAVGVAAGAATGGACFADGTQVVVRSEFGGEKFQRVEQLKFGDMVRALDDSGMAIWTQVMNNERVSEAVAFARVEVRTDDMVLNTTLTTSHLAIVLGNGKSRLVPVGSLQPGTRVPVEGGVGTVTRVETMNLLHRNILVTRQGTVLANGISVTTTCEDVPEKMSADATQALGWWREQHEVLWMALEANLAESRNPEKVMV